jgi:hypothetical protein
MHARKEKHSRGGGSAAAREESVGHTDVENKGLKDFTIGSSSSSSIDDRIGAKELWEEHGPAAREACGEEKMTTTSMYTPQYNTIPRRVVGRSEGAGDGTGRPAAVDTRSGRSGPSVCDVRRTGGHQRRDGDDDQGDDDDDAANASGRAAAATHAPRREVPFRGGPRSGRSGASVFRL